MPYSLLQLVQQVADEVGGIQRPSSVIGNTDNDARQLLAFCNKVGRDLIMDFEWQRVTKENVFQTSASRSGNALVSSANTLTGLTSASSLAATGDLVTGTGIPEWAEVTVVTETQLTLNVNCTGSASATTSCTFSTQYYDLPADYNRQISRTQWDRSGSRKMFGNKSAQNWQWLKGGLSATTPVYRYRILGNRIKIHPAPTTRLIFSNEYISNQWISSTTGGTPSRSSFSADTEMAIFPDDVMVNAVKYHWLRAKGLEYTSVLMEFNRSLSYAKAQDTPAENLHLDTREESFLIGNANIPDSGYGL